MDRPEPRCKNCKQPESWHSGIDGQCSDDDGPHEYAEDPQTLGDCEECGTFGVDVTMKGADGRSVCDTCRDK